MTKFIYLAGPIKGLTEDQAKGWRESFNELLMPGIRGISPLRAEPELKAGKKYGNIYSPTELWGTPHAIATKNWYDTSACDLVLAYLPEGRPIPSVGTLIEIGWGIGLRKPVVIVSTDADIIHHPIIVAATGWIVPNLETAAEVINGLFGDYVKVDDD